MTIPITNNQDISSQSHNAQQSQRIKNMLEYYTKTIEQKMYTNQDLLLDQLQQKTKQLKQTIANYRKQTSPENIDKLITQKRHQKQSQRQQLQIHWRNLTQKYKKLQQDQKRLNQENKQSHYDILNLEKKINQLKQAKCLIQARVQSLKQQIDGRHFMTQIKLSYTSPYKFKPSTQDSLRQSKTSKINNDFRSTFEKKTKFYTIDKQNNKKKLQSSRFNENTSFSNLLYNKQKFMPLKDNLMEQKIQIKNNYTFPQKRSNKKQAQKVYFATGDKYKQLIHYLDKPQVRQKVFNLLRKQSLIQQ